MGCTNLVGTIEGEITPECVQFLASRWALKEAMVKATQNRSLIYHGMFLYKPHKTDTNSRIQLRTDNAQNEEILSNLGVKHIHSSLSHEDDYSIAFVVLEN